MPKIMFDATGMFKGMRLRALDTQTRLYYPYILMLADLYGRIELAEEAICDEFASFKDETLTPSKVKQMFDCYEQNSLCFIYKSKRSRWAAFDTPLDMRREYPSVDDSRSPAPPEPEYTEWLKSLHDEEWDKFHMGKYRSHISEVRSAAGKAGAAKTNAKRWGQQSQQAVGKNQQESPVVVVDGVVVDVGVVVEEAVQNNTIAIEQATGSYSNSSDSNFNSNGNTEATDDPHQLALQFMEMVAGINPDFDEAKLPPSWEKLWADDFSELLERVADPAMLQKIMAISQHPSQAKFNVRPAGLLKNLDRLLKLRDVKLPLPSSAPPPSEHYTKVVGTLKKYQCVHCERKFDASLIVGHLSHCDSYKAPITVDIEGDDELA